MRSWFSHFSDHWDHLQDLLQRRRLGPRAFDLLVLEKDLRITCISNKVPGGAGAAGLGVMLGEPLQWNINSPSRFSSRSSRAPRPSHASAPCLFSTAGRDAEAGPLPAAPAAAPGGPQDRPPAQVLQGQARLQLPQRRPV